MRNAGNGFTHYGIDEDDNSGYSVSSAGDINGDGIDDIIIRAPYADGDNNSTYNSGESYVVFTGDNIGAELNLSNLDGTNGFVINGIDDNDTSGILVSSAGDINGDGIDDIIIRAPYADGDNNSTYNSRKSYVVFAGDNIGAELNLSNLDGTNGFVINGIDDDNNQ